MPPKIKVTKENIICAAVEMVRASGFQGINARNLASALGCSTQPVFSNFATMEELRMAVIQRADLICQNYIEQEIQKGIYPAYKASGMAYIRFAKDEKELFKLLYMRDRTNEADPETVHPTVDMESIVQDQTGLGGDRAKLFHLEMWAYVHGIATMFATGFLNLEWELVSKMLTDSYQGLMKQYTVEG